jgi:FtsH-binding integral membrane protein
MIDYTKALTGAQKGYDEGLRNYMLKIYNYMALALVLTGISAFATLSIPVLSNLMSQTGFGMVIMVSPVLIALYFFMGFGKMSIQTAQTLFWVYAVLTGMSLSYIMLMYTGESIARTFFICASVFGAMSIYGYTTQRDLTSIGTFLVMGLIGLIVVSIINMLLQSPAIYFATSLIGVGIFVGLIAWDTQKLKSMYYAYGAGELGQKASIMGAFTLYLDFINLFLYLLRFFGQRRN